MGKPQQPKTAVGAALATLIVAGAGFIHAATAQDTVVLGSHGGPSVEVDLSVLDHLPQTPTLPELLRGRRLSAAAFQRRGLRLPGEAAATFRSSSRSPAQAARPAIVAAPSMASTPLILPAAAPRPSPMPVMRAPAKSAAAASSAVPAKLKLKATPSVAPPPKVKIAAPAPPPPPPKIAASTQKTTAKPAKPAPTKVAGAPKAQKPPAAPKLRTTQPAPPPKPKAVAKTKAAPKPATTVASAPASTSDTLQVPFAIGQSELTGVIAGKLDGVIKELMADESKRVQLMAYSTAPEGNSSKARRLSLSRALSVRSYLMGKGVRSTRMDVRALGDRVKSGPPDRVDVIVVTR